MSTKEEKSENPTDSGVQYQAMQDGSGATAATVTATPNPTALRLVLALIIMVLLVISFMLGRATASNPTNTASATSTTDTHAGSTDSAKAALAGFVAKTGLIPGQDFAPSTDQPEAKRSLASIRERANTPTRTLGRADAPVTLTVLEDFSCPMCTKWQKETMPSLQPLIDNGTLKLQWYNMVIFEHEYRSDLAAYGSIAAMNQGKTWEYVKAAYGLVKDGDHPTYDEATVLKVAQAAGIPDMAKFKQDMHSEATAAEVAAETSAAQSIGVSGTPFFVLGDSVISGAYPADYFLNTIKYQQSLS